jgi:hypothetical protein
MPAAASRSDGIPLGILRPIRRRLSFGTREVRLTGSVNDQRDGAAAAWSLMLGAA